VLSVFGKLFPKNREASSTADRGTRTIVASLPSEDAIEQMPFADLVRLVDVEHRTLPEKITIGFLGAIYRRAMEIAYHGHGTSDDDRTHAALIAKAIRESLLNGGESECPPPLRAAIEATEYRAKATGYGTLHWLLAEHDVPPAETIQFVIRPEHAHLLGGLLNVLKPNVRAAMRPGLIGELLRTRRASNGHSLVSVAHGLAVAYEPATLALFNAEELGTLRNAHRNYGGARTILAELGLLPVQSSARSFQPQPPQSLIAECVALELLGEWSNEKESEPMLTRFLSDIDDRWQDAFTSARFILCCHLAFTTIDAIYGNVALEALKADLPYSWEKLTLNWDKTAEEFITQTALVEKSAEKLSKSVDAVILGLVLDAPSEPVNESDLASTRFSDALVFLSRTRVRFLSALRFALRGLSEGYLVAGRNNSLSGIDIMKKGIENIHPSLWEDVAFCAPFDQNAPASMA
jgi:hypothetical protein